MWFERTRRNHVYVTYALTFLVILPILFRNSPFSLYFVGWSKQRLVEKATDVNELKFREAARYLSGLDKDKSTAFYGSLLQQDAVDLTVAVVTVNRSGGKRSLGYLTQVVAELDKMFKADVHFKKAMFICNTFAGPGQHEEAEDLARYFPVETRFPRGNVEHAIRDIFEKEKRDYVYCLQKALQYPTNHVIMIEDDAVPRRDMLDILKHVLDTRVEKRYKSGELVVRDWAYVKLFHPDRWLGYTRDLLQIIELISIGVVGGSLYLLASLLLFRSHDLSSLRRKYKTFLCGALYCILVAVVIGRQNVHAVQRLSAYFYSVSPAPDCCSPAILFNAETAIEISSHLATTTCNSRLSLDLAMSQFAHAQGFTTLLVQPNVVRHIGLISTLKGVSDVPEQFAFPP
ncbi:hypothetical protein NP493_437g05022 [Ridgeia piscesae]|uniref:Transmembrane protein 246 n=1 Tax=Ridgeia piscesae TaxID=27915 RepID=A0AAD9NRY7_RIDPI|nr:hypothetical protein NP493_437g05022 [Ridgeia piscesae]